MNPPQLTVSTFEFTVERLAQAVRTRAILDRSGVALWIAPDSGAILVLSMRSPMTGAMLDASSGARDGLVSAYVGCYRAPVSAEEIVEDIRAHDKGRLVWRRAA